jgi:hypothetical protein
LARRERIGLFRSKIRGRLRAMRNLWLASLIMLVGCSSEALPPPDVRLLVGQENETWSSDPAPTRVQVEFVSAGVRTVIGQSNAPAQAVIIRNPGSAKGTVGSFEVTGFDAADTPIVRGASVPYLVFNLATGTIPVFVARAGTWSRPPENLEHGRNHPVALVAWKEYIITAGGQVKDFDPAIPDVYDPINWRAVKGQLAFPRAPKSMVLVGMKLLCIDESGASSVDFNTNPNKVREEPAPAGLTFAEVAGGDVVQLADGSFYVVGATRATGDATTKVLRIDPRSDVVTMRAITLATARRGAAAGVVAGNLVVWGGSAEGAAAEALTKAQDAFSPLPFPPDATAGLALATLEGNTVLLAGGKDPVTGTAAPWRTFDATCAADCAPAELAMPPLALDRTHVFSLAAGNLLVTGESEDQEFHAFSMITTSGTPEITERPLRERRKAATTLLLPNGQPGVLGGEHHETGAPVLSIESFFF